MALVGGRLSYGVTSYGTGWRKAVVWRNHGSGWRMCGVTIYGSGWRKAVVWRNQLWQWLEEGCRKGLLGVCAKHYLFITTSFDSNSGNCTVRTQCMLVGCLDVRKTYYSSIPDLSLLACLSCLSSSLVLVRLLLILSFNPPRIALVQLV